MTMRGRYPRVYNSNRSISAFPMTLRGKVAGPRLRLGVGEARGTAWIDSLDRTCYELFSKYPLAVTTVKRGCAIRSIVLMLGHAYGNNEFFELSHNYSAGRSFYSLRKWRSDESASIEVDTPDIAVRVLTCGVPIPRHGSLFGWVDGDRVAALVATYARHEAASPEPYWTMLPLAGSRETQWPPFRDEADFGHWFWKHHRAGKIRSLESLVAATPGTVFWVDTKAVLGSDCCAIARDVRSPEGYMLPLGRYVHYAALRAGKPVPSLRSLLACPDAIDLASRLHQCGPGDN